MYCFKYYRYIIVKDSVDPAKYTDDIEKYLCETNGVGKHEVLMLEKSKYKYKYGIKHRFYLRTLYRGKEYVVALHGDSFYYAINASVGGVSIMMRSYNKEDKIEHGMYNEYRNIPVESDRNIRNMNILEYLQKINNLRWDLIKNNNSVV